MWLHHGASTHQMVFTNFMTYVSEATHEHETAANNSALFILNIVATVVEAFDQHLQPSCTASVICAAIGAVATVALQDAQGTQTHSLHTT